MSISTTTESEEFLEGHSDFGNSFGSFNSEDHQPNKNVDEKTPSLITQPSTLPVKTQVLPLVYIQTQSRGFTTLGKAQKDCNVARVFNNMSQLQLAGLQSSGVVNKGNKQNLSVSSNQGVILAPLKNATVGKPQQLVIHKPQTLSMVQPSGSKITTGTILSVMKPMAKLPDSSNSNHIQMASAGQKYVLTPMPKVIKNNRPPVTMTTNSLQPKIHFMPFISASNDNKTFNIKFPNITKTQEPRDLTCDEVIDLDSPVKSSEKEYELSIMEDSNSKSDSVYYVNPPADRAQDTEMTKQKEIPKYIKHPGISILKKHYNQSERLKKNNNQTVVSIVDPDVQEKIAIPPTVNNKTERRRKSNFSYRKDYDENTVEISIEKSSVSTTNEDDLKEVDDAVLTKLTDRPENEAVDVEMVKDEFDLKKVLNWDEGIASLPGSNLKFILNEFGLVEYLSEDEYNKVIETRMAKVKENKVKNDFQQQELQCAECSCYGMPSEFITPKYCSMDCQETGNAKQQWKEKIEMKKRNEERKRKRKKAAQAQAQAKKPECSSNNISNSDEDDTSNENSQDKYSSIWTCTKKGFSWTKYLDHVKAKAAPVKLFKDPFPYNRNGFRQGMKMEGVDPQHPSYFCVFTVAEVCGYRIRLHFDGYPDNYDFWVNADSMDIFPVGWCEKHGHVLQAPHGYTIDSFNWMQYLKQTRTTAAPKHLFANRAGNTICPNGFRVGMKLEAVDRKNTSLVCVATVRDMMDNRILVHFDSWDDIYDYWADPTSPYIHPVGWCDQTGHNLTPPNDYPNPETFSWNKYLKETKSVAAPVRSFKQRPACGFKRGMRLECVDKRVPQLIRAATVDDVQGHQLKIHFDGWPVRYSYWVDDDSDDIHPVGWCQKTGHPIETPLTPDDVYDFLECPTVGCRGVGHMQGARFSTHSEQKDCPYAEENIDTERTLRDRLLSPDKCIEAVVPVQREPPKLNKPRIGRPPKYARVEPSVKQEDDSCKKGKRPYKKRKIEEVSVKDEPLEPIIKTESEAKALIDEFKIEPAEKCTWEKHTRFLKTYVKGVDEVDDWTSSRVAQLVESVPGCDSSAELFKEQEIDGEAFLSLSQKDLIDMLKFKVGPAIKLYNIVVLLRGQERSRHCLL